MQSIKVLKFKQCIKQVTEVEYAVLVLEQVQSRSEVCPDCYAAHKPQVIIRC